MEKDVTVENNNNNCSNYDGGNDRISNNNKSDLSETDGMDRPYQNTAIQVISAFKRHSQKSPNILDSLSMTVPRNSIYSLLGASGCGKTTLLSCITGQNLLDSGIIHLSIRKKNQLGFMPQQISIFPEFTIEEMLIYYGLIYGMTLGEIHEKAKELHELLHLNKFHRKCGSLSGGQQRRVSLAITLLHDPELLILDEPTSGIDLVIAEEIWNHLLLLANRGRTILITTHYIDEAKKSHMIGFMRQGVLLEEAPPQVLLNKYRMSSLEDVFLHLSSKQREKRLEFKRRSEQDIIFKMLKKTEKQAEFNKKKNVQRTLKSKVWFKGTRLKAQIWKHLLWIRGNPGMIAFMVIVPFMCVTFFNLAVGQISAPLPFGVINGEANQSFCNSVALEEQLSCDENGLYSCVFLDYLKQNKINLIEYATPDKARYDAKRNYIWGFLDIPHNFSKGIEMRLEEPMEIDELTLGLMEIGVEMDRTDFTISLFIMREIKKSFSFFLKDYSNYCNLNPKIVTVPPILTEALFGSLDVSYLEFAGPAMLFLVMFYMTFLFTFSALIAEKKSGIIERNIIAGMTLFEILLSHMFVQAMILLIQVLSALYMQYKFFNHPMNGNMTLAFIILYLQGVSGTLIGLVTSLVCTNEVAGQLFLIGTTIPVIFLTGFIWPVEAIVPTILRYISQSLPSTFPVETYRSIAFRGFGFLHRSVYRGFISSIVWNVSLCLISLILLKYKKSLI